MINTIISKYPHSNSQYIYKKIEENLINKEKSFLIVPEQYTLQTDINLMDNISFNSVMDAKVLSFSSLSSFILDRVGGNEEEFLSKAGKIMLITNILTDLNDSLVIFKNNYHNIDFVNEISTMISNFKDNKFEESFFQTIGSDGDDEILKLKFKEIKLIYDTYQKEIENSFIDSEDRLNLVITRLSECDFLKGANFYFDKFDYLSDIKLDFISELIRIGSKINISLTLDKSLLFNPLASDLEIYDMANKFYIKLSQIDRINEIDIDKNDMIRDDISHLYENFEKYNPMIYHDKPQNIHVLESTSTKSEVENIALIINKLILSKNIRYNNIALYITDSKEYENEIIKIFNRYFIPIFLDKTSKLSDNHIIKVYLALLRLSIYNFRKDDLFFFLRSNLFDFGEDTDDKVIIFQNYIENRKIKGDMFLDDKYFKFDKTYHEKLYKDDIDREVKITGKIREFEIINDIRDQILDLLKDIIESKDQKLNVSQYSKSIFKLIDNDKLKAGINNYQNILNDNGNLDNYKENEQVRDKFIDILEELVALMGERIISLERIYKLIESVSEDTQIGIIPPSKDHVIVTDFKRSRVSEREIVFILGMNDLFFPSKSMDELLIGKDEKDKLKELDLDLKIYEEDLEEREKLNLYKLMTTAKKLYFSFALSDSSSDSINKSIVLNGVLNIFPKIEILDLTNISFSDLMYSKNMSQKFALNTIRQIIRNEKVDDRSADFSKAFIEYIKTYGNYERIYDGIFYTNNKLRLSEEVSKNMYNKNHFNVTEIETYSKCPYRYFIGYGLKPSFDDNYDVDNREIGNIVHNSLEDISRLLKDVEIDQITNEKLDMIITENFEKSISKNLDIMRKEDPRNKFILKNIYENTKNSSKEVLKQLSKGKFVVEAVEESFGYPEGHYPAVFVDDENYLRGRIDRIDRYEDYIRIIDYKTGGKIFKIINILNGLDLQLLVYMMSANAKKDEVIIPIGSFYMPLKDELSSLKNNTYDEKNIAEIYEDKFKMSGLIVKINEEVFKLIDKKAYDDKNLSVIDTKNTDVLSEKEIKLLDDFAKHLVSDYIKEIKTGNINLNPIRYDINTNECQYCDFREICKFDESIDQDKYRDFDKDKKIDDLRKEYGEDDE